MDKQKTAHLMNSLAVTTKKLEKEQLTYIADEWLKLEKLSSKSFFTSWKWIGCWLKMVNYDTNLITVYEHNQVVGMAFFSIHKENRTFYSTNQLWINRTGKQNFDQIWSEYNDILCPRGREWSIRTVVLDYLTAEYPFVDEFVLGVSRQEISETPCSTNLFPRTIWETKSYSTTLKPEFGCLDNYLATLSKNTRHQIRRSIKLLNKKGDVKLKRADSLEEALRMLSDAGKLHRLRWKGGKSGFNNSRFRDFHHELIKRNFSSGCIDILSLSVNGTPACFLYNFIHHGYVYFYLSGIKYEDDNKLKPGLVAHALAISLYAGEGKTTYDFMGGRGQYKASLCSNEETLLITSFQRKRPLLLLKRWIDESRSRFRLSDSLLNERG